MGKKSSKQRKPSHTLTPPQAQLRCSNCGTVNGAESAFSFMDQLLRSHAELCQALRLTGRQMLRFEKQDDESLERIRQVLKRADNMRKMLQNPDESTGALNAMAQNQLIMDAPRQTLKDSPVHGSAKRRSRLTRPRSPRIIRFPAGSRGSEN